MTTDNFCFYLQNRLIQTSQTGGQWYSDTSPLVFPDSAAQSRRGRSTYHQNGEHDDGQGHDGVAVLPV